MKFLLFFFSAACFAQITYNPLPTRVIGQDSLAINNLNPNLVEGREFFAPQGIALDTSTNPPTLYVSDTSNNRVLGFRNATSFANGQSADLVLGQPDLATTLPAGPSQSTSATLGLTAMGLTDPTGVTVDAQGNVYVVDSGNNRILRFPQPFVQTGAPMPDIAIGQASFTANGANQGGISAPRWRLPSTVQYSRHTSHWTHREICGSPTPATTGCCDSTRVCWLPGLRQPPDQRPISFSANPILPATATTRRATRKRR